MKIGLTELLLIICITAVALGPAIAAQVKRLRRWCRRAKKSYKRAERRAEAAAIQRKVEMEIIGRRLYWFGIVLLVFIVAVFVWALIKNYAPQF